MRIKSLVLVLGIVAMLFGAAGSAGADPINAKNAEVKQSGRRSLRV